jgi:signal transduction histidine kinase
MAQRRTSSPVIRRLTGLLTAGLLVAAVTGLVKLGEPHVPTLSLLVLYLLAVLPVAVVWGTPLAVVTALLSVWTYAYFFVAPLHSLLIADAQNAIGLAVFLVTAVVVGELAARLRRAALVAERLSDEQSALRRVATQVAKGVPAADLFTAVTREVGRLCDADLARMERYEPDGTVSGVAAWSRVPAHLAVGERFDLDGLSVAREVRRRGGPVRLESFAGAAGAIAEEAQALGIRSSIGCPINVGGRLWGVIAASTTSETQFPEKTEAQIAGFTELVATAIENAEARTELMASRARVVVTADRTRRQIERNLHDGAQQRLVSLALQLQSAQAKVPPELVELSAELDQLAGGLGDALDELRETARGIHPAILAEGGLNPALKALARRSAIPVQLDLRAEPRLSERVEASAYYFVSEALTNAAKHSDASLVTVTTDIAADVLRVEIHDNGQGGADFTRGTGLLGLRDRVEALGGRLTLDSPRGAGTTLTAELPLTDAQTDRAPDPM